MEQVSAGVRLRIYLPPGKSRFGLFALNVTARILQYFGDIWGLPYSAMNRQTNTLELAFNFKMSSS